MSVLVIIAVVLVAVPLAIVGGLMCAGLFFSATEPRPQGVIPLPSDTSADPRD